jgi:hypothetical protein
VPNILPVPINVLPDTEMAYALYFPMNTLSSLNTSKIGNPDISFTANKLPLRLSATPSNTPFDPMNATVPSCSTSSLIDDDTLPENTIVALLLVFGDFNIIYDEVIESVTRNDPVINMDPVISRVVVGFVFPIPTNPPVLNMLDSVSTEPLLNFAT